MGIIVGAHCSLCIFCQALVKSNDFVVWPHA